MVRLRGSIGENKSIGREWIRLVLAETCLRTTQNHQFSPPRQVRIKLFRLDALMDMLKLLLSLITAVFFLGCREQSTSEPLQPTSFELTIRTIEKHASTGRESTSRWNHEFRKLENIQARLSAYDWQHTRERYEIEIIRRENPGSQAKLEIKRLCEDPCTTEFLFYEDLDKPNDNIRVEVEVGNQMMTYTVVKMIGHFFEPEAVEEDKGAK